MLVIVNRIPSAILGRDALLPASGLFVRHAYFTGADEPYEKLKRALRAEID